MRATLGLTVALLLVLQSLGLGEAGLLHRRFRDLKDGPAVAVPVVISEPVTSQLRKDQIPVTIIELQPAPAAPSALAVSDEQTAAIAEDIIKAVEAEQQLRGVDAIIEKEETVVNALAHAAQPEPLKKLNENIQPVALVEISAADQPVIPEAAPVAVDEQTAAIAEDIIRTVEAEQQLRADNTLGLAFANLEKEPTPADAVVAVDALEQAAEPEPLKKLNEDVQPAAPVEISGADQPVIPAVSPAAIVVVEDSNALRAPVAIGPQPQQQVVAEPVPAQVEGAEEEVVVIAAVAPTAQSDLNVRQVTEATTTQTSTPQNFVQQLIQNSPIGQFLNQFTSGQQQQLSSSAQAQAGQVATDEQATPAPTLPGFLNPITSAQQAVQSVAQSVVNSTTQAFQGIQQFASNLGNQFQNTLSSLGGQQTQLSTSDSTTTRRPGPLQSIVNNFVSGGGNNNNNDNSQAVPAAPGQPQGPLQGILNFFQVGNRPQTTTTAANTPASSVTPAKEEQSIGAPAQSPAKPITLAGIDNKIEIESDATNEVQSDEDSFEEAAGGELITVNDDTAAAPVQSEPAE